MPHLGARDVFVGEDRRRTAKDFASCLDYLSRALPKAEKIILVMDNLNTHKEASLYEAFPPEKARGLCERFEFHYTPKHGSWLNMAETEDRATGARRPQRIGSVKEFRREIAAYLDRKNENPKPIDWQFTNKKARVKLRSLYPAV